MGMLKMQAAIIRELNVGPVMVLGWSMGRIVALCWRIGILSWSEA